MQPPTIYRAAGFCVLFGAVLLFADSNHSGYQTSVAKWRQSYEASLKADDGWLTVAGLFWLHEGENRIGSDPLNDIVLAPDAAPAEAGSFLFNNRKIIVQVRPGVPITLNGKRVQSAELHPDSPLDQLQLGDLTLYVHASGERFAIRLRDKNSKLRKEFTGLHWFPIDESYRVKARYVPYTPPKQVEIQNVLGDFDKAAILGYAAFSLRGQEYRLEATEDEPGKLFFCIPGPDQRQGNLSCGAVPGYRSPAKWQRGAGFQRGLQPALRLQSIHDVPAANTSKPAACGDPRGRKNTRA